MTQAFRYRAFESIIVKPFETFDDIFNDCKIMVDEEAGYIDENNIHLGEVESDFECLKLRLDCENDIVLNKLNSLYQNLTVNVILRDQDGAKNYEKLHSISLQQCRSLELDLEPVLPKNYLKAAVQIVLVLIDEQRPKSFERLATKRFKFIDQNQSLAFPRVKKTPEEFEAAGFYRLAPFSLKWVAVDIEKPINELVELWINTDYELQMLKFASSSKKFAQGLLAVQVYQDLLHKIIVESLDSNNFEGEASKSVFGVLRENGVPIDEVQALAGRPDFKSIVNSWAIKITGLNESLKNDYS